MVLAQDVSVEPWIGWSIWNVRTPPVVSLPSLFKHIWQHQFNTKYDAGRLAHKFWLLEKYRLFSKLAPVFFLLFFTLAVI